MKTDEYTPLPINELLDLLSKNWGVPYGAEEPWMPDVTSLVKTAARSRTP